MNSGTLEVLGSYSPAIPTNRGYTGKEFYKLTSSENRIPPFDLTVISEREIWSQEISNILRECSQDNWSDGNEKAITVKVAQCASEIIELLCQDDIPIFDIVPDPRGYIAFNWRNKNYAAVLTVFENNYVYFSKLDRHDLNKRFSLGCNLDEFKQQAFDLLEDFILF
ncbi:MAG: hypothetical protein LBI01_00255 [Elusimicrobium sp.]|jgi:hypothetical protein|nr:hypothetical protein [Elusimicrobium sp.]